MSQDDPQEIERLSPDRLIQGFRQVNVFVIGLALAFGFHVVLLAATSVGYIADMMKPPPEETTASAETSDHGPAEDAAQGPTSEIPDAPKPGTTNGNVDSIPENLKNHQIVRDITEVSEPPPAPKMDFSIDEADDPKDKP